jgi:hypothetical protein
MRAFVFPMLLSPEILPRRVRAQARPHPVVPTSPCLRISSIADVIVAEHSCRREGNAQKLRASFAVLQTFSNHSESQSLYLRDCGLLALAIGQDARRLQDLGQALAPAI